MELDLLAIVAEDEEGYLIGSTLDIAMAAMQICLGMHASYPLMSECMTSAWPLCASCDGVGFIGNCGIGKKRLLHGIHSGYGNDNYGMTHGHACKLPGDIEVNCLCLDSMCQE